MQSSYDFNGLLRALGKSGGDMPAHIARKAADANMLVPGLKHLKQHIIMPQQHQLEMVELPLLINQNQTTLNSITI